jgi:hypothetical protein
MAEGFLRVSEKRWNYALAETAKPFYFRTMKRMVIGLSLSSMLLGPSSALFSQDPTPLPANPGNSSSAAAALADRQDAEERYRRLNSAIEELIAAEVQQRKRINELADQLQKLREDVLRANQAVSSCASAEDLKRLAKSVQEIEQKRAQDQELIKERFEELKKLYKSAPVLTETRPAGGETPPTDKRAEAPAGDMKGYEYEVKAGDTLSLVVQAYRKQGVKVTSAQVIKANPGLNPNRLITGKKIFIPDPALK